MTNRTSIQDRLLPLLAAIVAAIGLLAGPANAQDAEEKLDQTRAELDAAQQREGVQTSRLQSFSAEVTALTAKVAAVRRREAQVQAELREIEARLDAARLELSIARERLKRAIDQLEDQLVAIYKSDGPDMLAIILNSDGYDDVLSRAPYLNRIQAQGESITTRVRELRDQKLATIDSIRSVKAEIAAKEAELEESRIALERQEARLDRARARQQAALARTRTEIGKLQGDVDQLEKQVQEEIQAAQKAAASSASQPSTAAAVPVPEQSGELIWPVEGTVTSPFGPRWGSVHEGIDIGAPDGTPIRAAGSGTVIMAGFNGGYGNYTCIDHGGGLSTCYAHQSSISVSVGAQVSQGDVIGEVGNTGNSFGAHLHLETRVNGVAEDPLGYL